MSASIKQERGHSVHALRFRIKNKNQKGALGMKQIIRQRGTALFLLVVFLVGVTTPSASAIAATMQLRNLPDVTKKHLKALDKSATTKEHAFHDKTSAQPTVSKQQAAADSRPGGLLSQIGKTDAPVGEALQSANQKQKITPHELTDKRTATSSVSVKADGSLEQKNFFLPKFYQKEGKWDDIDMSLMEDKNAGDSGNVFGRALGQVESWFSSTKDFMTKANDWQARFSPSDSDKGMVRIKKGSSQIGFVPVNASTVDPDVATKDGKQVVRYNDLWPGVDVEYVVQSNAVKENIILKIRMRPAIFLSGWLARNWRSKKPMAKYLLAMR